MGGQETLVRRFVPSHRKNGAFDPCLSPVRLSTLIL
jgi:hypothetical protein